MHHMRFFTRAEQGTAYVKDAVDLPERRLQLLKVHWNCEQRFLHQASHLNDNDIF